MPSLAILSVELERKLGRKLSMHTGINSGLVVTGDEYIGKGRHGLTGDTINLAKRLTGLAKDRDIFIGAATHAHVASYFTVEEQAPTSVKGKAEPVKVYNVLALKDAPEKLHRSQGVRAKLIGRDQEMAALMASVQRLRNGQGSIITIVGDAGTGKSRLVEEFKSSLNRQRVRWIEGRAYPYAQNISYFPLIDLLNQAFGIKENDSPETVGQKLDKGIGALVADKQPVLPYITPLYALDNGDAEQINPQFWMLRLQEATGRILAALARSGPTVVCLEDLHWADPSFLEMIRVVLAAFDSPVLLLCVYRPDVCIFDDTRSRGPALAIEEIRLHDLSAHNARRMVASALGTADLPDELGDLIYRKTEGNPFYLEEMINSLIEAGVLVRDKDDWHLTREITAADISATVHGVIAARLDRLDAQTKQVLQEASVIGQSFYHAIIQRISRIEKGIDVCLETLERFDIVKQRAREPDLEYIFKHALTQEVAYNGLLKKQRRAIHERIGRVMEMLFQHRLSEYYEALAYHFSRGESVLKAVDYLVKSGEKSLRRYAVDEAHQHFQEALNLITRMKAPLREAEDMIVDLLNRWAIVFYYRGDPKGLERLLSSHEQAAAALGNSEKAGLFAVWQGFVYFYRAELNKAYEYLQRAKAIGELAGSRLVVGYAFNWLSFLCAERGCFEEGIHAGEAAHQIALEVETDSFLHFKSLTGVAFNHFYMGNADKCNEIGKVLIDYGQAHSHVRCLVMGHGAVGHGRLQRGDFAGAIASFRKAVDISADPFYRMFSELYLAQAYVSAMQIGKVKDLCKRGLALSSEGGIRHTLVVWELIFGVFLVENGEMNRGMKLIQEAVRELHQDDRKGLLPVVSLALGRIYIEIVKGEKPVSPMGLLRNIGFVLHHALPAEKKALAFLQEAVETADALGAVGIAGQAHLELGMLHRLRKRAGPAQVHLEKAAVMLRRVGAHQYLKQAEAAIAALPERAASG